MGQNSAPRRRGTLPDEIHQAVHDVLVDDAQELRRSPERLDQEEVVELVDEELVAATAGRARGTAWAACAARAGRATYIQQARPMPAAATTVLTPIEQVVRGRPPAPRPGPASARGSCRTRLRRQRQHGADAGREHGQDHQRHGHHRRRFVGMAAGLLGDAHLAPEGQEVGPEGVESRQDRRQHRGDEQGEVDAAERGGCVAGVEGGAEDLVLAPEAGERRQAGQGQGAAQERPVRHRHHLAQAAEAAHVDDVAHRVHDAAGGQEQQGLEEGVREQMEHRAATTASRPPRLPPTAAAAQRPGTCSRAG